MTEIKYGYTKNEPRGDWCHEDELESNFWSLRQKRVGMMC